MAERARSDQIVWTDAQRAEVAERARLRRLFDGAHETYFVLPNGEERRYEYVTVNWLGDLLSQTWKRLLFREFPAITTKEEARKSELEALVKQLDLETLSQASALQVSWAGRAVWKAYWSVLSKSVVLELWGKHDGEQVFFDYLPTDPSQPVAVNFWYALQVKDDRSGKSEAYWVCERHELSATQASVRMTTTAYKSEGGYPVKPAVPLARIWPDERSRPEEQVTTEGLTVLPCVVVHNVDRNGDRTGDTDYTPSLVSLQKQINKLVASRQFVIDTCEEPTVSIPSEYIDPETQEVDWSKVRIRVRYEGEEPDQIDISGWTGNLQNSATQWTEYRNEFRALTGISPSLAGETEGTGGESGYARRLGMVPTEAEVGFRRHQWTKAFRRAIEVAQALARAYGQPGQVGEGEAPALIQPIQDVSVEWPPVIPDDLANMSQTTCQELREGARSLRSAVRRLNPGWTEEQIDAEVTAIENDRAQWRALAMPDLGNPFGRGPGGEAEE